MKTIGRIFLQDIKSVSKNLIIFLVVIGITILPALYAWFNIASNWDPYSNTGDLPFAVYSGDKGFTFKTIEINAGDELVDNLKQNSQMGWKFTDTQEEAIEGVENGEYYACVIVPEDFSENLLSIATGDFEQAKLQYYVNEKKNAVAPKITDKGIQSIQESIDSMYVGTLAKTIASVLDVSVETLEDEKDTLADKLTTSLNNAKSDVETFSSSVDLLIATLDSIDNLIQTNIAMKPVIENALSDAGVFVSDVKSAISSIKSTASQLTTVIDNLIATGDSYFESISSQLDQVFGDLSSDASAVATKLRGIETINQKIIAANNEVITVLQTIQSATGIDCSKVINKLNSENDKQQAIIDKIEAVCDNIETTGSVPAEAQSDLESLVADAKTDIASADAEFSAIKDDIDAELADSSSSLDDIAGFAQTVSLGDTSLDTAFNYASDTVADLKNVLTDLKTYLSNLTDRIDTAVTKVDNLREDESLEGLILPIIQDPTALGDFISSPVDYESHNLYTLKYYGSAMAPFYSSLALWVGGIVLVAVLNVDLSKKDRKKLGKANSTQLFFGRYLVFFVLGQIQALIIALGDLYFLKIEYDNALLFIVTCLISSFVYTLLIYSLTITFSVIGKALAVIILVIQIAGSGGTFPIEVLPGPFKALSPYMPFKYGINALRETVAGLNTDAYLKDIGILLLFIIPALLLGLLLRKPCIKAIAFFNHKIEESDLVI